MTVRSMTGFGSATAEGDGEVATVEVRTVNHRFCDVKVRLPRELGALEPATAARVRERLSRGSIEVGIRVARAARPQDAVRLDVEVARAWHARLVELGSALELAGEPTLADLAGAEGVLVLEEPPVDLETIEALVLQAVDTALDEVAAMREREGLALAADVRERVASLGAIAADLAITGPELLAAWTARFEERVAVLAAGVSVDPARLATEIAFHAERMDVSEELTRLTAHREQMLTLLELDEPVGRKLDFLVQEMNREVNTLGSKCQSLSVAPRIVDLKAELERIREQVQNIE